MRSPHALLLLLPTAVALTADPQVPAFTVIDVDTTVQIGYGIAVADVDGDRKPDIVLADKHLIVWYENPSWTKHVIAEKLTTHDHVCVAAQDIDGDGKCEIAVGAGWNPSDTVGSGAVFYLNPPADRTQRWEPVTLPHEPTVHRMRWVMNAGKGYDLVMVPLHGRGNKPVTGEGVGVKVIRYQKPAAVKDPWAITVLDDSLHKTHNFDPVQWDADPAHELLIGGMEGLFLLDPGADQPVMTRLAGAEAGGIGEVRAGTLGKDQRFIATIEPMHGKHLVLYRPAAAAAAAWTRTVLDESLVDGHALACGDFTGSGRDQIVVGWRAMNKPGVKVGIKLFTPVDEAGHQWKQTLIDDNTMACEDLCVADLNGDGRLDIVAAGRATKNVKVYLNQGVGR